MLINLLDYLTATQLAILLQPAFVAAFVAFVMFCHWLVRRLPKSRFRDAMLKERWLIRFKGHDPK